MIRFCIHQIETVEWRQARNGTTTTRFHQIDSIENKSSHFTAVILFS